MNTEVILGWIGFIIGLICLTIFLIWAIIQWVYVFRKKQNGSNKG